MSTALKTGKKRSARQVLTELGEVRGDVEASGSTIVDDRVNSVEDAIIDRLDEELAAKRLLREIMPYMGEFVRLARGGDVMEFSKRASGFAMMSLLNTMVHGESPALRTKAAIEIKNTAGFKPVDKSMVADMTKRMSEEQMAVAFREKLASVFTKMAPDQRAALLREIENARNGEGKL